MSNNTTANSTCEEDVLEKYLELYTFSFLCSIVIIIIYSFFQKRVQLFLSCLGGRPGILYPYEGGGFSHHRIAALATSVFANMFLIDTLLVSYVPIGGDLITSDTVMPNNIAKGFSLTFAAIIFGFIFYPINASFTMNTLSSYVFGTVYGWTYIISFLYISFLSIQCQKKKMNAALQMGFTFLPNFLFLLYLAIVLPRNAIYRIIEKFKNIEHLRQQREIPQVEYVRFIFSKNKRKLRESRVLKKWYHCLNIVELFYSKIYQPIPGFKYSIQVLTSVSVGFSSIYVICIGGCFFFYKFYSEICIFSVENIVDKWNLYSWLPEDIVDSILNSTHAANIVGYAKYQCKAFFFWSALSTIIGALITTVLIIDLLIIYRRDLLNIYQGNFTKFLITFTTKKYTSAVMGSISYPGYQAAYIISGYFIQFAVIWIICALIAELIIIPIKYDYIDLIWELFLKTLPLILPAILSSLLLKLMAHCLFVKIVKSEQKNEPKAVEYFTIDNRRIMFNVIYFTFFYKLVSGIFSHMKRLLTAVVIGLWVLPRLDTCLLANKYERCDSGYMMYIQFLKIERISRNPVMLAFVYFLKIKQKSKPLCPSLTHLENGLIINEVTEHHSPTEPLKRMAKLIWLEITLRNNPQLRELRKWKFRNHF